MSFWQITKQQKTEVANGFRIVGWLLVGMALLGGLIAGSGEAFGTMTETRLAPLGRAGAAIVALISFILIAFLVNRWARIFAGWIGYSVLNGLLMTESGHLLNSAKHIDRWYAFSLTLMFFLSAFTTLRFLGQDELSLADKAALLTWLLAFIAAVQLDERPELSLLAFALGTLALIAAWLSQGPDSRRAWKRQIRILRFWKTDSRLQRPHKLS